MHTLTVQIIRQTVTYLNILHAHIHCTNYSDISFVLGCLLRQPEAGEGKSAWSGRDCVACMRWRKGHLMCVWRSLVRLLLGAGCKRWGRWRGLHLIWRRWSLFRLLLRGGRVCSVHLICRRWSLLEVSPCSWVGLKVKLLRTRLLAILQLGILLLKPWCDSSGTSSRLCDGSSFTHDADDDDTDGWDDHKHYQR